MARVLIVEDEPITAADLELKLAAMGHQVAGSIDNGEEVVARAPALAPDLVLMDIRLHGDMTGIEAAQRLRAQSDVPIVFLTAFADQETIDRACDTEPHGYLVKPFTDRAVASAVQVALRRARAERTHVERERWMSAALRGAGEALVAVDEQGVVRFVNEHAEAVLQATGRDVLGKDGRSLLRFAQPGKRSTNPFDSALRDGQVTVSPNRELLIEGRDTPLNVAFSVAPVFDADGATVGAVMVFHQTAQEAPSNVDTDRASIFPAAQLSHRINNPLTYNLGALQLAIQELDELRAIGSLTNDANDPAAARRQGQLVHIESLLREAHEGATRIADVMRDFGRSAQAERDLGAVDPAALLDLAIGLSGVEALGYVHLDRQMDDAPIIRGNKWDLARVIAHALQRAIDGLHPRTEGTLGLGAGTDRRGWAEIRIAASAASESAPPARESSTNALGAANGSGAEMADLRRAVESYGGELVASEHPSGRVLQVRLPPMRVSPTGPLADRTARPQRGSVLVVDDEPAVAKVLEMTLRREYDITAVTSAASALALLERGDPFDVVLCDLTMPEMDGRELYERLYRTRPEIAARMVFMSGGATTERAERFLDEMNSRRIDKPFQFERLRQLLGARMRAQRSEMQARS